MLLLLAAMVCLSSSGVQAQKPPAAKALLRAGDKAGYSALLARGAYQVEDYGAFSLWAIDGAGEESLQAGGPIEQALHLAHKPAGNHVFDAPVDALVQRLSLHRQPDLDDAVGRR